MVITVLKATFTKSKPNVVTYRDFKLFNEKKKKTYLESQTFHHTMFLKKKNKVLGRHAPIKNKTNRANHAPYVTKTMRKAIIKGIELQHRYFKLDQVKT